MTQKKHRISPKDMDLKELVKELKKLNRLAIRYAKKQLKDNLAICGTCIQWCSLCYAVFPKGEGRKNGCPCDVYLQKDVTHVVNYLLLNLKI